MVVIVDYERGCSDAEIGKRQSIPEDFGQVLGGFWLAAELVDIQALFGHVNLFDPVKEEAKTYDLDTAPPRRGDPSPGPPRDRAHLQAVADAFAQRAPWDGGGRAEEDPMTTVTFDTLKYAEALKTAGVPDAQAKAQAEALADALRQGGMDLATKADIVKLRIDIAWIKWILTAGVGVYLAHSIAEWISMTEWFRLWAR